MQIGQGISMQIRNSPRNPSVIKLNSLVWSFSWISNLKQKMIEMVRRLEERKDKTLHRISRNINLKSEKKAVKE